jgi:DNA-binding XRE family transcriptional regulator
MNEIERLQLIIEQLLMTKAEFAKSIDVSKDTIYNILDGKTKITARVKGNMFKTYTNINREWFETGIGEMFTWKQNLSPGNELKEDEIKYSGNLIQQLKDKDFVITEQRKIISQQRDLIDTLLKK